MHTSRTTTRPYEPLDSRQRRTRTRLTRAILDLAADGELSDASISQLCRSAGINRSTFYAHGSSLPLFLEDVLGDFFRDHVEAVAVDASQDRLEQLALATLRHVQNHAEIYRRRLNTRDPASDLRPMLARILRDELAQQPSSGAQTGPASTLTDLERHLLLDHAQNTAIAAAIVAAVSVWFLDARNSDHHDFLRYLRDLRARLR